MQVALFATKSLGVAVLDKLRAMGCDVLLVTTDDDVKLYEYAASRDVCPLLWHADWADAIADAMRAMEVRVVFAAHWDAFVPREVREASPTGVLAYHPSLLPWHRGNDSVAKTVNSGKGAGGSVYVMDEGYDTGPVVIQRRVELRGDDDASSLWRRELFPLGVDLIGEVAARMLRGERLEAVPQRELEA